MKLTNRTIEEFDAKGNMIRKTIQTFGPNRKAKETISTDLAYDSDGSLVRETSVETDSRGKEKKLTEIIYTLGSAGGIVGKTIETIVYSPSGEREKSSFETYG